MMRLQRKVVRTEQWIGAIGSVLLTSTSYAQLAPTGGHYAGGAGAGYNSDGYSVSVPLDLPGDRGGLPVPIGVTYGGDRLGAAGVGFDVPLSFVRRDLNLMHRRPAEQPGQAVTPREQVVLSLGGQMLDLVPTSTSWVARRDAPQLRVVEDTAGATWTAYDGEGLTYTFSNTLSGNSAPAGCSTNT